MKRFYREVSVAPGAGGFTIQLDGRTVRTPDRADLALPTAALADAIADEWRAQGDTVSPATMRLIGLANAAIDKVRPARAAFAADLAKYGESDLLCYRAGDPADLVAAEAAAWDPLLGWAQARYDIHFEIATGIVHRAQPPATVARLAEAVFARDDFALAALSPLVRIAGSLVIALAVAEAEITAEAGFDAAHLDEVWQAGRWGEDAEAIAARTARKADFVAAARFIALLG
ncbi:ATP12 family protein [Sphingomonas sp. 1P06PA]|uniref:ATP12 family chaperone protein n=1 Tax=Sphingomonas sp. 1P06PA TaxID=554121 RepID=UPI0039A5EB2E